MTGNSITESSNKENSSHIFSGWKDIAHYLGKGVRTVQRYERELALPVRRPGKKSRGSVVATRTELDAWIAASPVRQEHELQRLSTSQNAPVVLIKENLEQMKELQRQMTDLRADMMRVVILLTASVNEIRRRKALQPYPGFDAMYEAPQYRTQDLFHYRQNLPELAEDSARRPAFLKASMVA